MAVIRFVSPIAGLELPGVPAKFTDYVFDIDESNKLALSRMRYQGAPYGVTEQGEISGEDGSVALTEAMVAIGIASPESIIGAAVTQRLAPYDELSDDITVLRSDVDALMDGGGGGGGGIVVGNELPVPLESGSVAARLRTY